jgi:hypothetical protein
VVTLPRIRRRWGYVAHKKSNAQPAKALAAFEKQASQETTR